jgi:hypothetical protein
MSATRGVHGQIVVDAFSKENLLHGGAWNFQISGGVFCGNGCLCY